MVDSSKPTVSFKINKVVNVVNLELEKGRACVKGDFNISNKSLFISFILHPKTIHSTKIRSSREMSAE